MDTDHAGSAYAFGPFQLDPEAAELRRDALRIELRPKCLHLLLYLVRKRGRLVSREELLEQVWGDVVVGQETLSRTVTEVRQALGDVPDAAQYIETVPRLGYRFIAAVTLAAHRPSGHRVSLVHRLREYPLHEGAHVIGRGDDVSVRLYATLISRHHARIRVVGNELTLEDLGSKNGTLVNGVRVDGAASLHAGDTIDVGGELLVVRTAADSTATAGNSGADHDASR